MAEQWLPVKGYEGLYEVSDHGRVKTLARTCANASGTTRRVPGRLLKPSPDVKGYLRVSLCKDGTQRVGKVHRLVAEVFLGPCPDGLVVAHGPKGKQDNSVGNLSYKTQSENHKEDRLRDGTDLRGEKNVNNRINKHQVLLARHIYRTKRVPLRFLADAWGVSVHTLYNAARCRTWSWL